MHRTRLKGFAPGFTLVELMVTIAIVAILATIAFPSFESSLRSNRVATTTNELLASISLARSEAIRSTESAVMCASTDGATCATDWNDGWIIWTDEDSDGTVNGAEAVARRVQAHDNLSLAMTATGGANAGVITFDPRGRIDNGSGGAREFVLRPSTCNSGQKFQRRLQLLSVGQVNTTSEACP